MFQLKLGFAFIRRKCWFPQVFGQRKRREVNYTPGSHLWIAPWSFHSSNAVSNPILHCRNSFFFYV